MQLALVAYRRASCNGTRGATNTNAPLTNFAVLQALPMIAEANPQTGLLMESLMATVAQSDQEAKRRIRAFLDHKTAKVKPGQK